MTKRRLISVWTASALLVGGIAFACYYVSRFGFFPADVKDTTFVSPDGAHIATLHSVNTGAAGSYCQALLRRTAGGKDVVLVDGGWEFVEQMQWRGSQTLIVTIGFEGKPDASWPKSSQGVKIVYK